MASREVFLDTSALYALIDKRDAHHTKAREALGALIGARRSLLTSDYIVTEAVNLANARGGIHVALRILELLERSVGIRIEWIGSERFGRAVAFFRKHADHRYSLTDCSSFVLMRELELTEALTTDRHFSEAGFRVLVG
jgi:predicted nucleic acid-binding protein